MVTSEERVPELPKTYGRSRLVMLAVDPFHVHAYWELTDADADQARTKFPSLKESRTATWVLRFHDVTCVEYDGTNAHGFFDVVVHLSAANWYVELWAADKGYVVELGLRSETSFVPVCRSNFVHLPRAERARADREASSDPEAPSDRQPETSALSAAPGGGVEPLAQAPGVWPEEPGHSQGAGHPWETQRPWETQCGGAPPPALLPPLGLGPPPPPIAGQELGYDPTAWSVGCVRTEPGWPSAAQFAETLGTSSSAPLPEFGSDTASGSSAGVASGHKQRSDQHLSSRGSSASLKFGTSSSPGGTWGVTTSHSAAAEGAEGHGGAGS